jgi:hypothetical protein
VNINILETLANKVGDPLADNQLRQEAAHKYHFLLIQAVAQRKIDDFGSTLTTVTSHVRNKFMIVAEDGSEDSWVRIKAIDEGAGALCELSLYLHHLSNSSKVLDGLSSQFKSSDDVILSRKVLKEAIEDTMKRLMVIAEDESIETEKIRLEAITSINSLFTAAEHGGIEIDREPYNERFTAIVGNTQVEWVSKYAMNFGIK